MKKRLGRRAKVILGVVLAVLVSLGAIAIKVRIGLGPLMETAPLLTVEPAPSILIFHDVNVFTGTEQTARLHQDVVVSEGKIQAVRPTGEVLPSRAEVIEGSSHTLLPGLIDAHVHVYGSGAPPWAPRRVSVEHQLEAYVYSGVTSGFVLGGVVPDLEKLNARAESGEIVGPRFSFTHMLITAPNGHPTVVSRELVPWPISELIVSMIPQPRTKEEAHEAVASIAAHHVHFIKVIVDELPPGVPAMKEEILTAIVDAARERGLKVFAHIGTADDAMLAVRAGVAVLAHGVYRGRISKEQAEEIARHKVPVIYTLGAFQRTAELGHGSLRPSALDEATVPAEILDSLRGNAGQAFNPQGPTARFAHAVLENESNWADNVRTLREAGVTILVGTDSPLPGVFPGASYHFELSVLSKAGIPNGELLLAATSKAADVLGLEVGRIEAGRPADLLFVEGDPLAHIEDAAAMRMVVLRGKIIERRVPLRPQTILR